MGQRNTCLFSRNFSLPGSLVSGGGDVDENRRFENPVRLTVKK
jgi:hypothetical protein